MLAGKLMAEGLGLGVLMILICAAGIRRGAVGMVHLYDERVRNRAVSLGLITEEGIRKRSALFRGVSLPLYIVWVLVSVYAVNGARGFLTGFWQIFAVLSVMNLIDRLLIDEFWVGHTQAWIIPGTEDLRPYITVRDKRRKWILGTVGTAFFSAVLSGIMALILR